MVSNLYSADVFYQKQKKKQIAVPYTDSQKLQKDSKGFYLNRTLGGKPFKLRVAKDDLLYTRAENGVTLYSPERDAQRKSNLVRETKSKHSPHAHKSDRKTEKKVFKI